MLDFLWQLIANIVSLLCVTWHEVYREFIRASLLETTASGSTVLPIFGF